MQELRLAPLPGYAEYFLDCAVESYELDACSHTVLRLFGDEKEITAIVEPPAPITSTELVDLLAGVQNESRQRYDRCEQLTDLADQVLTRLDPELAGGLVYHGLIEIPRRIEDLAQTLSSWAVTDETVGGDMKPFRKRRDGSNDERVNRYDDPPPRLARRLASPRFVRNYIRNNDSVPALVDVAERSISRTKLVPPELLRSRFGEVIKLMGRQRDAERMQRFQEMEDARSPRPKPLPDPKRKLLRRAAAIAETVIGSELTRAFVKGDEVELPGNQVSLVIARRGSLAAIGHGNVAVAVKDPISGEQLAQLCVYFEDTPALDQLTAFALHMQAGLEEELINTANITSLTERGTTHPLFQERARKHQEQLTRADEICFGPRSFSASSWERDRARSERYWLKTGSLWTERLSTYVLGRRQRWLQEAIATGKKVTA